MAILKRLLVGRPLATVEQEHQRIPKTIGLAVFSSDAISSTAYATEEILFVTAVGASSLALGLDTLVPIGTRVSRPSSRLEPPSATTKRISSVAYAVDEMASEEKTASAIVFGIRWCSISVVARGRPTKMRLTNAN